MKEAPQIIVIGAGPVGLFTTLLLVQAGIRVSVYEKEDAVVQSPRAIAYFPSVLEEFEKAGILQDVIQAAHKGDRGVDWRDADRNILASIDAPQGSPHSAYHLPQPDLCDILLRHIANAGLAQIRFGHTFVSAEQLDNTVRVQLNDKQRNEQFTLDCQYLIGADGGRSSVRKSLGLELEGFTWKNLRFVAVNILYDLDSLGWKSANFIVDEKDWGIVVKRGQGPCWRIAMGMPIKEGERDPADEEILQNIKARVRRILPGDTENVKYEAVAPYTVHQRCASRFREGNIILAGDAAHLNNPVGGLGLTTGLLDAAHLGLAFRQHLVEGADDSVLTTYAEARRKIFLERTNPITTANLLRLMSTQKDDVAQRKKFFKKLNDPQEIVFKVQAGLPDLTLTTTSTKIYNPVDEVTWFISVTKEPSSSEEKFLHEYKNVHANMTRKVYDMAKVLRRYVQLENSAQTISGTERPEWNFVTCLDWPSLFFIYAGLQDPGYKATAGSHVFCRLDQHGTLAKKVHQFSRGSISTNGSTTVATAILFHHRTTANDEVSDQWLRKQFHLTLGVGTADERLQSYSVWRDITPKDTDKFFHGTLFAPPGSWLEYKAVELFNFTSEKAGLAFFEEHGKQLHPSGLSACTAVIGAPDVVVPGEGESSAQEEDIKIV